ncbi:signal peptidase I [Candidatus Latescibacterota bacterium]
MKEKSTYKGFKKFRKEWIEPILIAFVLAGIIRSFIIQPYKIPSGSMEDTLLVGDHLMAAMFTYGIKIPFSNKFIVRFRDPRIDDIIVFRSPVEPKNLIKRCIAVGGQKVEVRNKEVYVNDKLQPLPKYAKFLFPKGRGGNFGPVIVPAGHMFVMGDNRDNSYDSRFWGYVPYENIKGNALFTWWSWNHNEPIYDVIHKVRWNRIFNVIK